MSYIIGVDCGTSGTKTVLFDELGTVVASHTIEYPMYQPKNGYAEQDPNDWASAMIDTNSLYSLLITAFNIFSCFLQNYFSILHHMSSS